MNDELNVLVARIREGDDSNLGVLVDQDRVYVAMATDRYDLLPMTNCDPVEAWFSLPLSRQEAVREWRNWPGHYLPVPRAAA